MTVQCAKVQPDAVMATRCKLVDSVDPLGAMQTEGLKQNRFTVLAMLVADLTNMLLMLMTATRLMACPPVPKS